MENMDIQNPATASVDILYALTIHNKAKAFEKMHSEILPAE